MLNGIRTALFDFDGTLAELNIDFDRMRGEVRKLIADYGLDGGMIRERFVLEMADEAEGLIRGNEPAAAARFRGEVNRAILEMEIRAAAEGRLVPAAPAVLRRLKGAGWGVGIITRNSAQAVRIVLKDSEMPFDALLTREDVARVKPHPDHVASALERLGARPDEALLVGDGTLDMEAGRRSGLSLLIGVLTGTSDREALLRSGADHVIGGLADLLPLLTSLNLFSPDGGPASEERGSFDSSQIPR